MNRLSHFSHQGREYPVTFVETSSVKEGVQCDVYRVDNDTSKDLAVIEIQPGFLSPRQRIVRGTSTIQRFISGQAHLSVTDVLGKERKLLFKSENANQNSDVAVQVGEIMQWSSIGPEPLVYHEICEPPYEEGRFENLLSK